MKNHHIAVCSWSLQPESPAHLVQLLGDVDISRVQLALSPLVQEPEVWAETVHILGVSGIEIVSGMMAMAGEDYSTLESIAQTGGVRLDEHWRANRQHAEEITALAQRTDLPLISFHGGFLPEQSDDPQRAVMIERLQIIADLLDEHQIRMALETGQESAGTLLQVLSEIDRPNVGVNFDPANMILYDQGDPVRSLQQLTPHVMQIHVKDALPTETPGTWGCEVCVGQGMVDWKGFFKVVNLIEQPIDLVIEREAGEDRAGDIVNARKLIEQYLEITS